MIRLTPGKLDGYDLHLHDIPSIVLELTRDTDGGWKFWTLNINGQRLTGDGWNGQRIPEGDLDSLLRTLDDLIPRGAA